MEGVRVGGGYKKDAKEMTKRSWNGRIEGQGKEDRGEEQACMYDVRL
jgi:hypothetical protein